MSATREKQRKLRASHRRFAQHYFQHHDVREAARAAGSKATTPKTLYKAGYNLLNTVGVQAFLEEMEQKVEAKAIQTVSEIKAEVHGLIDESINLARQGTPLVDRRGETVYARDGAVVRKPDITGLLKGAELKGKTVAMFTDRQEIAGEMEGMSQEELETFFLSALLSNAMLLEKICHEEVIVKKVHEIERRDAERCQGDSGDGSAEADDVSTEPEAGGVSQGRLH